MGQIHAENCNILSETALCLGACPASVYFLWFKLSCVQAAEKSENDTVFYYCVPIFFQLVGFVFFLFSQATCPSQMT